MKPRRSAYARRSAGSVRRVFGFGFIILACVAGFAAYRVSARQIPYRQTIVIAGNPFRIVSFSGGLDHATILTVPPDTTVPAVMGYGQYRLEAIEELDRIDQRGGTLIMQSTANAFGVPVLWYAASETTEDEPLEALRSVFSWGSVPARIMGRIRTTVPLVRWISMVSAVQSMSADAVETSDASRALTETELPDGSRIRKLDENRFDYATNQAFIDTEIRTEGMSVAVYNTTGVPGVGERAARIMSRIGLQPVYVGNSPEKAKRCRVRATAANLKSNSAIFLREYFRCDGVTRDTGEADTVADLIIELGTDYSGLY